MSAALPTPAAGTVTRDRILDEAEALFAEHGYAGTSVRDIAGAVSLTPASLYNHFDGKEALYTAVLERGIRPLVELMQGLAAAEPRGEAVDALLERVMEHLARRPHLPRLIHHEAATGGAHIGGVMRDWIRPLIEQARVQMQRVPESGWEPEEYPLVIAAWIHMVLGHFALAPLFRDVLGVDPLSPDVLRRQTGVLRKFARQHP
ncbi:MAG: TetR/AcrR family transcriptional regulator [Myxococcota bacterium]